VPLTESEQELLHDSELLEKLVSFRESLVRDAADSSILVFLNLRMRRSGKTIVGFSKFYSRRRLTMISSGGKARGFILEMNAQTNGRTINWCERAPIIIRLGNCAKRR
jgi:hypothetical protein